MKAIDLIRSEGEFFWALERLMHENVPLAVDTETTGLHPYGGDVIRGISVANEKDAFYFPISHPDSRNFDPARVMRLLRTWSSGLIFHHAVFDWAFLDQVDHGADLPYHQPKVPWTTVWDTQVINWLMDENLPTGLKESCERIFGHDAGDEKRHLKAIKERTWGTYTAEDIGAYAAMDARLTWDLWRWQEDHLDLLDHDVRPAIEREMDVQRCLYRMIRTGVQVDPDKIEEGAAAMREKIAVLDEGFAKDGVNPGSPKQVGHLLYDTLGYTCPILTKTGKRSTAMAALESLAAQGSSVAENLLAHRHLAKALQAYFTPLAEREHGGRIHAHFSSTRTVTGRYAGSNPNLMTIPREDTLPEVRRCFTAAPGYDLWEFDLAQAELRVMAGYANEPAMMDAINEGRDLHSETAASIFGEDFTPLQRRLAKNLNFGFAYGIGPAKFATYSTPVPTECAGQQAAPWEGVPKCRTCDVCKAEAILDGYKETYPKLTNLMDGLQRYAMKHGVVPSYKPGRYRHFRTPATGRRKPKPYTALNFIVQGGIGEFMKDVMIEWYRDYECVQARLVLQVHDALVFEVKDTYNANAVGIVLQEIADKINPFTMRMVWEAKAWA